MDVSSDLNDVLTIIESNANGKDYYGALPTVLSNYEHMSPCPTYSKEERLIYNAQYKQAKRRRGDSGYSGTSSTSMSDCSYDDEIQTVLKSLKVGNLRFKNIDCKCTKIKSSQRPQYQHDGSRGNIKSEDGSAVAVTAEVSLDRLQWRDQRVLTVLMVRLTNVNGLPAKHFEVYNIKQGACKNVFQIDENVFLFGDLHDGKNNISLERVGIRRKEEIVRAGKLEKECWLTCTLYLLDTKSNEVFYCGIVCSDKIKCEQEIGSPAFLDMEPKKSSYEGGGVLVVKGKNLLPGSTKVFFKGAIEYECQLAENMASNNMQVCYIPHSKLVGGTTAEVFVKVGEKRSASLKFQYKLSQSSRYNQNEYLFPYFELKRFVGDYKDSHASYVPFPGSGCTSMDEIGNQDELEDQILSTYMANEDEILMQIYNPFT